MDEQLHSLENQKKYFEELINDASNWIFAGSYIDEGISGTSVYKRTNFLKMINDGINGNFDMILTKEVSRFARNTIDSIKYTECLLKNGVIVNFINDNINTVYGDAEFRLTLMSSLAQDEVRKLSERVKFGFRRSIKDGRVLGGGNITGYYKKDGKLFIDEDNAPIIKMLFELYATGEYSFKMIAKILFQNGYKNSKGSLYDDRVLSRMITNPKYKGYYCGNKSYIEDYKSHKKTLLPSNKWIVYQDDNIPALVSTELWNRANKIYQDKTKMLRKRNKCNCDRTYKGKIICKEHNTVFVKIASNKRSSKPVWVCREYCHHGLKQCLSPILPHYLLERIFKEVLIHYRFNNCLFNEIYIAYEKMSIQHINNVKEEFNNKIQSIQKLKDNILKLYSEGCISSKEFKKKNDEYNNNLNKVKKELIKASKNENDTRQIDFLKQLKEEISNEMNTDNMYLELFNLYVDSVYVSIINGIRQNVKFEIKTHDGNYKSIVVDIEKSKRENTVVLIKE